MAVSTSLRSMKIVNGWRGKRRCRSSWSMRQRYGAHANHETSLALAANAGEERNNEHWPLMSFTFPSLLYTIADTLGRPELSFLDLAQKLCAGGARLLQ